MPTPCAEMLTVQWVHYAPSNAGSPALHVRALVPASRDLPGTISAARHGPGGDSVKVFLLVLKMRWYLFSSPPRPAPAQLTEEAEGPTRALPASPRTVGPER